ncbi:hypothetical protein CEXT_473321 [Caerostris extrusa]|uniref:Uncharacterized protein n=1 Tax=Caerostris extrusa TaxID=172846 RepID=A0AAV4S2G6_CAEEX|nr:hypothetical protein CEXT_473321 [Caerostris extrusa]
MTASFAVPEVMGVEGGCSNVDAVTGIPERRGRLPANERPRKVMNKDWPYRSAEAVFVCLPCMDDGGMLLQKMDTFSDLGNHIKNLHLVATKNL